MVCSSGRSRLPRLFQNASLRPATLTAPLSSMHVHTHTHTQVCTPACTAVWLLSHILALLSYLLAALQVSGNNECVRLRPCVRHRQKASLKTHKTQNCLLKAACAISLVVCQSLWFGPKQSFTHLKLFRWNDRVPGKPGWSVCFPSRNVVLVLSSNSWEVSRAVQTTAFLLGLGSLTFGRQNKKLSGAAWLFLLPRISSSRSPNETMPCSSTAVSPAKPAFRLKFCVIFPFFIPFQFIR